MNKTAFSFGKNAIGKLLFASFFTFDFLKKRIDLLNKHGNFFNIMSSKMLQQFSFVFIVLISMTSLGQTTANYSFSDLGSSNVNLPSGSIDTNISFTTATNSSGIATSYNGVAQEIRFYNNTNSPYHGGSITVTANNGATITAVEFVTADTYTPVVRYSVGSTAVAAGDPSVGRSSNTYSVSGLNITSSLKFRNANTSTLQLRLKSIKVTYTITAASPPVVTGGTVNGAVGTAITNYQIVATNSPTSYSIASGTLPAGLSLNTTTGVISGTPTAVSSSSITVNATNGAGTSASAATITFNIAKGNQTITFGALANKAYGDADFNLTAIASSTLAVTYISSNTNVATVLGNTVTIVGVGTTNITASQSGDINYNAATNVIQSLTVTQRPLTITGLTAINREYNATNVATVSGTPTLSGFLPADSGNVVLSGTPSYTFANAAVANNKTITTSGLSLTGSAAANYSLTLPSLSANVTRKALTVTGAVAQNKAYDGTTVAIVTGATLNGVETIDVANVNLAANGAFASANVGTGIAVTLSLTGSGIANYILTQPGLSANITAASQTITFNALPVLTMASASVNLNTYASSSSGLTLTYSSSNPLVVSVSGNTMTVVGPGTAIITASQAGNVNYAAATSATQNVVVLTAPVATAATAIAGNGFTANWNAVAGATSYEIDVYKVEGGMSNNPGSVNWSFATASPSATTGDITVSILSHGNNNGTTTLLDSGSASSGYTGVSGTNNAGAAARTGVLNTAASGSAYFQFTVTPDTGASVTLTGISFGTRSTGTGPQAYALRSSLDNYATDIATGTMSTGSWVLKTNTGLSLAGGQDEAITFRLFGYNGTGSPGVNTANWRIDDLALTMTVLSSSLVNTYELQNENVGNVTSYNVTGLDEETEYHYVVRAIRGGVETGNSNEIEVTTTLGVVAAIWDGSVWSNNNDGPTATIDAIIEGEYITAEDGEFTAKSLTINTGGSLVVSSGNTVTVVGGLNNTLAATAVVVESNAVLLQEGENELNSGNITVRRNSSAILRQDYTLWSSPVIGQGLYAFSKTTLPNRFYTYNTSTDQYSVVPFILTNLQYPSPLVAPNGINGTDTGNTQFAEATSYLIRTPWNHPTAPTVFAGEFTGVPNSGDITYEMSLAGNGYNAVGNPYPSKLNVVKFIEDNPNITGTLYFWRKTNSSTATTYATLTSLAYNANQATGGDTGTGYFDSGDEANWVINVGQGFLVQADTTNEELYFTNSMRRGSSSANQFFRTSNVVTATNGEIQGLYWLNLSNATEVISQTTVGYTTNSTLGVDNGIDGKNINKDLYLASLINGEDFAVQGRPSFEITDVVPMSYKVATAGNYRITIDHVTGLFNGTQAVYLKDKALGVIHNLTNGAYIFTTETGVFANRFEIVYRESALGVDNPSFSANQVVVYKNESNQFVINTGSVAMNAVKVFDVRGRLLTSLDNINTNQANLSVEAATQVLLVQITSADGATVTKKVVR